jgi:hypothetical protein
MCNQTGFGTLVAIIGFVFFIDPGVAYARSRAQDNIHLRQPVKMPTPSSLAPQQKGTVGRGKCLRDVLGVSARFRMTPRYQASIGESLAQERFSWP